MIRKNRFYSWNKFFGDCAGGMIAALIALPYGLSMAALMGLPPVMGVLTSILTAPVTALLGRNQVLIGGTASATVPFIASAVRAQGIGGAAKVSIVAAVFMMAFSVLRLGRFVGTVPNAVLAGFSAGTGAIMITSQWSGSFGSARWQPAMLAAVVVAVATLTARLTPRFPAPLAGITAATLLAAGLHLREPLIGSLSLAVPPLAGFSWSAADISTVLPSGLALAFVVSVNLLMTSRVVEHFQGPHRAMKRADADAELGAYGIANLLAGVFGAPMSVGIPARSLANLRCGGTTRFSNILHAAFLVLLVQEGSSLLAAIPLAALAGVTIWMGICLLDWSAWRRLPRMRALDAFAFVLTAVGVVLLNPVAAVLCGCSLYSLRYLYSRYAGMTPPRAAHGVSG